MSTAARHRAGAALPSPGQVAGQRAAGEGDTSSTAPPDLAALAAQARDLATRGYWLQGGLALLCDCFGSADPAKRDQGSWQADAMADLAERGALALDELASALDASPAGNACPRAGLARQLAPRGNWLRAGVALAAECFDSADLARRALGACLAEAMAEMAERTAQALDELATSLEDARDEGQEGGRP